MPDYEIRVLGPIGPTVASIFPEFRVTVVADSVHLSGTAASIEYLIGVITLLCAHNLTPVDTVVSPRRLAYIASERACQYEESAEK